ncbi:hypothetical protein EW145_g7045 [Phellinidium pouzarii]|uniref:Intradiol ring-cleavage dioxygenases domain-containing protein n=1 Tax=Phellinidium pouzarii TaxID=167371 RepID=A0A4S4KPZ0_9AGAM|nr:hypothetical protein EW145_g7045 [Phellinidium pouzarii]
MGIRERSSKNGPLAQSSPELTAFFVLIEHCRKNSKHLASKRHLAARNCAPAINAFHAKRRVKRALPAQIPLGGMHHGGDGGSGNVIEDAIHSYTCVTAPEIEEGPYYVNNELVRQDLTEDQKGVPLRLDIGVIDTATCEPVQDAFIEIWSCNATGVYGAFESNIGGPPPGAPAMSSRNTWLRGGHATDATGTVELTTIYPGFYYGRTIHVHLMVHLGWEVAANGSIISHAGSIAHIGQLFFDEPWNDRVLSTQPYTDNTARRTLNTQDHDFARASIDGSSAVVQLDMLGDAVEDGLLGFITIGIDTTAEHSIHSTNYYNVSTGDFGVVI